MKYIVKIFMERPMGWNSDGKMDHLMGKIVETPSDTSRFVYDNKHATEWVMSHSEMVPIKELPQFNLKKIITPINIGHHFQYSGYNIDGYDNHIYDYTLKTVKDPFAPVDPDVIRVLCVQFPKFIEMLKSEYLIEPVLKYVAYGIYQHKSGKLYLLSDCCNFQDGDWALVRIDKKRGSLGPCRWTEPSSTMKGAFGTSEEDFILLPGYLKYVAD